MRSSAGDRRESGVLAPVEQGIGAGDHRQRDLRRMFAQDRPNLFDEKSISDDIRKMAERSDEEQPLAGAFDLRE